MPGTALLSKLLLPATSFEELTPPRPPTKVRVLSPELRDALQAKALAMERAKRSGKPIDEAMLEEAEDLENGGAGLGQHGPGGRRGPFGPHGPAGRRYGRGHYGGYAGSDYDDYDRYGPEGYDPNAYGSQAPNGRRRRPRRYIPYKGDGKGGGSQWIAGDGAREGGSSDAGNGGLSVPAGKRPPWELAPPDVVPWHGDTEHGPCDADDVFSVREVVRKIAPLLIGSGCEKYVMDADKMLNDLPTDRDTTRMPACKNNFIVKSTAKTVYSVEKCAIKALAKAEHVNATEENKIKELVKELTDRRRHVLVPLSMFSTPAKFAGKAKMSKKDWDSFEKSGAAGTLAMDWGGSGGTAGRMQKWPGQPGRYGRPRGMRPGQHGQHMQQWAGQGQGPGGNYGPEGRYGDTYGERPHPKPPLQPGMVPGGGGMGGMGTGQELTPKQQYRQNVVDHAKELAKANEDIVGPFKRGKHLEEFPPPVQPLKPIYPYPQPPILESETASVSKFPVFSGPDAPDVDVSVSAAFPLNAPDSFAVGAAFLLLSSVQQAGGRRRSQAFEFLAVPCAV